MIVSFDFDNTLTVSVWRPEEWDFVHCGPNLAIVQCIHAHLKNGNDVHIVTSRNESVESKNEIEQFLLKQHLLPLITGIHFTNGKLKASFLDELGVTRHHDDDECEIEALQNGCEGILVKNGFINNFGNVCDPFDPCFHHDNCPEEKRTF